MARSRSITANLSRFLSELSAPLYVIDESRKLVYLNQAAEDWLQISGDEIVGRRCDYHSEAAVDRATELAASLCPPPDVFTGATSTAIIVCPTPAGPSRRRVRFSPISEDAVECEGVIALVDAQEATDDALQVHDAEDDSPRLHAELQSFRLSQAARYSMNRLVGKSPAMRRVRQQVEMAIQARPRLTVVGPSGSGREHVARTIHLGQAGEESPPLLPLAGPLLDAEMLQSSITAFVRRTHQTHPNQPGALLVLDADVLSEGAQTELAGFLALPGFDLPVLTTAHTPLLELAIAGNFRQDLAIALSTLVIELPPLVERPQDVPLLAQMFVERINAEGAVQHSGFTSAAIEQLCAYPWPENIDELAAVVREVHERAAGPAIDVADLPRALQIGIAELSPAESDEEPIVLDDFLRDVEYKLIRRALRQARGNKTKAAELLGVSRPRLHRRIEEMEGEDRSL